MNMKIKTQMLTLLILVTLLLAFAFATSFYVLNENTNSNNLINAAGRQTMLIQKITKHFLELAALGEKDSEAKLREGVKMFANGLEVLKKGGELKGMGDKPKEIIKIDDPEIHDKLIQISEQWKIFYDIIKNEELAFLSQEDINTLFETNELILIYSNELLQLYESYFNEKVYNTILLRITILGGLTVVILLFAFIMTRKKVHQLQRITEASEKFKEGDFSQEVSCKSGDEIGTLANGLEEFRENIVIYKNEIKSLIASASEGNLDQRANSKSLKGEWAILLDSVNELLDNIAHPINEADKILKEVTNGNLNIRFEGEYKGIFCTFQENTNNLIESFRFVILELINSINITTNAVSKLRDLIDMLNATGNQQTTQAEEIASAVEELSRTLDDNKRSNESILQDAKVSGNVAEEGRNVVKQTVATMKEISNVVNASADNIVKLGESGKKIGEVVNVINEIAEQTNMLALNAAIEAARAGEQGRGFAVVADEVRKLAERTSQSTQEIADMINNIQSETDFAVKSMQNGTQVVEKGIVNADKADEALQRILNNTNNLIKQFDQIADVNLQQASTGEEISRNLTLVKDVISETSDQIQQASDQTISLSEMTSQLTSLLDNFQVNSTKAYKSKENNQLKESSRKLLE